MPQDFTFGFHANPGATYSRSRVLLARAHFNGLLELLTQAWEGELGYSRRELKGKTLGQLMWSRDRNGTKAAIAAILEESNSDPVDIDVRDRDGRRKHLRLHRMLDAAGGKIYIVAELHSENPGERASA
jgi:PAS domain S-box-containing protein